MSRPLASVWKAERADGSTREPRFVVMRIAHHAMDPRAMTELRSEYEALRSIDDPRVRKAHGYYVGHGALALEFVDGVSLTWVLAAALAGRLTIDVATVIDLGVELCEALRVVHGAGVVHGRICTDTVRLRRDGSPVLTDFAIPAERVDVAPPEYFTGAPPSPATDQWLLGALLAKLLTGEALLGGTPGNPGDGRRDLSAHLAAVSAQSPAVGRLLARMLARDSRDRYGDWGMLTRELLAALRHTGARPDRERLARRAHVDQSAPALLPSPSPRLGPPPRALSAAPPVAVPIAPPAARAPVAPRLSLPESSPEVQPRLTRPPALAPMPEPARTPAPRGLPVGPTELVQPESPAGARLVPMAGPDRGAVPVEFEEHVRAGSRPTLTPTLPDLVEAVPEELDPADAPPAAAPVEEEAEEEKRPAPAPAGTDERLVPDWAASFALVLLLAVGLWAVLSRFL